jgi:hypothetical protein
MVAVEDGDGAVARYTIEVHDATTGQLVDRSAPSEVDPEEAVRERFYERRARLELRRDGSRALDPGGRHAYGSNASAVIRQLGFDAYDVVTDQVHHVVAPGWTFKIDRDDDGDLHAWPEPSRSITYRHATGARIAETWAPGAWRADSHRRVELVSHADRSELVLSDATGKRLAAWTKPKQDWPFDAKLAWSGDGRFVYAPGIHERNGGMPELYVWRSSDLALLHVIALSRDDLERWSELVALPGGPVVVATATLKEINLATGKVSQLAPAPAAGETVWVQLAPDNKRFALAGRVYDTQTRRLVEDLGVPAPMGAPFSADGQRIVVKRSDGFAIHTIGGGKPASAAPLLATPPYTVPDSYGVVWSSDGATVATSGDPVMVWDVATGTPRLEIPESDMVSFRFVGRGCLLEVRDDARRPFAATGRHGTRVTNLATRASIDIYGTATPDPKAKSPDTAAEPTGLLVIASDGRYAGDTAGLALVRLRTATDVRSAMTTPAIAPDAAKAVALLEEFVAACK